MCGRITLESAPIQLGLRIVSLIEPLNYGAPGQEQWVHASKWLWRSAEKCRTDEPSDTVSDARCGKPDQNLPQCGEKNTASRIK